MIDQKEVSKLNTEELLDLQTTVNAEVAARLASLLKFDNKLDDVEVSKYYANMRAVMSQIRNGTD